MLCVLPDTDPRRKRCENRPWKTSYTGPLLIHSGKSRSWLKGDNFGLTADEMVFGAIVGVCRVEGCAKIMPSIMKNEYGQRVRGANILEPADKARWPWLEFDEHAHGEYGMILGDCRAFPEPITYRGFQGFFDVPQNVVAAQLEEVGWR